MKETGTWRWAVTLTGGLALAGCALPQTVHRTQVKARQAMANSDEALSQANQTRAAQKRLQQEVRKLAGAELALERQLEAAHVIGQSRVPHVSPPHKPLAKTRANAFFPLVIDRAKALAQAPYKPPKAVAPVLQQLTFDEYGKLKLAGPVPGWIHGTRFHLQLYPAGYLFKWPEKIFIVRKNRVIALRQKVQTQDAALAKTIKGPVPPAGFSVYTPFTRNTSSVDEFLSFLGASYFRVLGAGQTWGLSARGVAVDTALPHRAEEFPYFRAFWVIPPHKQSRRVSFCALLDSPSLTGAYRFVVTPGRTTVVNVKEVLFERRPVRRLGIAPLTSMFLQGRFSSRRFYPLIRAAHDSDGLLIATQGGKRLWWPLRNPKRLAIYRFPLTNPRGFGLMQRARNAGDYRAFGMHYGDRPSAWVTPLGAWGKGHLLLVELPTNTETNDNITVFWVPKRQPGPNHPMTFSYTIAWKGKDPRGKTLAYVAASRHAAKAHDRETYVINFRGLRLAHLAPATVRPHIQVWGPARIVQAWAAPDGKNGQWRLQFTVAPTGSGSATLHAALVSAGKPVTETWADIFPLP